jgi:PAS domain S-box-containing protein
MTAKHPDTPLPSLQEENERLRAEVRRLQAELCSRQGEASLVAQRYRSLIERLDAIFWEADVETFEFTYVSPRAEPMLGYPMDRWLHEKGFWVRILHPDDRDWVVESCVRATAEGRDNDFVYRAIAADGRLVWLRDMVYVEMDAAGTPRLLRGVMLDITAQMQVENELRRTGAAKDQFLAMLAHELRNPLGAVSNALQVMRSTRPGQAAWERAFQVIERQVQLQVRILNDLLEVSSLSRGKAASHRERLDLRRLAEETLETGRGALEAARLTARLEAPDHPFWIEADPTQISQVLSNLFNNAVKFTEPGGSIAVRLAEAGGARVEASVEDTGIGIDREMLPHVWEVFSQADSSLDRRRGGLGLGLALVKALVELNGGEVRAESPGLGKGSSFSFLLPRLEESGETAPAASPVPAVEAVPEAVPERGAGPLRVLVIEDNVDAAETLQELLDLYGYRVAVAHSGPAGIDTARVFLPDVVLCDIGLPGMDGYAVARQLRREPEVAGARLIALTGYGRDSDRESAEEAGFDLHLVKPVEPLELRKLLG